ncbi:unnamed protein product [Strongylus vulgaris]|uniref:PIPK domain-containing protein n=1 Tax=Strongylus vulgaris TaxID=40348 RepID=A0A3P7IYK2_STRVU|nr:unnamed protein product [Strongylus vulgaris]
MKGKKSCCHGAPIRAVELMKIGSLYFKETRHQLLEMLAADTAWLSKMHLMDYSLLLATSFHIAHHAFLGIHDCERAAEEAAKRPVEHVSEESADELCPTPPDSPIPSTGAFPPLSGGPDLDDEYYAIASHPDAPKKLIYFIGLVDILTYYGVKKRTATAAKTVKYGSDAENISTVKPDQVSY